MKRVIQYNKHYEQEMCYNDVETQFIVSYIIFHIKITCFISTIQAWQNTLLSLKNSAV